MAGTSGFQNLKRQVSADPASVGQLLAERAQTGTMQPSQEMAPPSDTDPFSEPDQVHQMGNMASWPSAAESALRGAIYRARGVTQGTNPTQPAPYNRAQLLRLGLSEDEIDLLNETGGAKV